MAEKTKTGTDVKSISQKSAEKYSKERILASSLYKKHKDLLSTLLDNNKSYTKNDVNEIINSWLKRRVN